MIADIYLIGIIATMLVLPSFVERGSLLDGLLGFLAVIFWPISAIIFVALKYYEWRRRES